jgi:hypothetical protein
MMNMALVRLNLPMTKVRGLRQVHRSTKVMQKKAADRVKAIRSFFFNS